MYLVIDTWVWVKAQTAESPEAGELLYMVLRKCEHKIVVDCEEEIINEYKKHIAGHMAKLFQRMSQTNKILHRPKTQVNLSHFDPSDMKFIQVALSTPDKIVISGDSDFINLRQKLIMDHSIELRQLKIMSPEEALYNLDGKS